MEYEPSKKFYELPDFETFKERLEKLLPVYEKICADMEAQRKCSRSTLMLVVDI